MCRENDYDYDHRIQQARHGPARPAPTGGCGLWTAQCHHCSAAAANSELVSTAEVRASPVGVGLLQLFQQ